MRKWIDIINELQMLDVDKLITTGGKPPEPPEPPKRRNGGDRPERPYHDRASKLLFFLQGFKASMIIEDFGRLDKQTLADAGFTLKVVNRPDQLDALAEHRGDLPPWIIICIDLDMHKQISNRVWHSIKTMAEQGQSTTRDHGHVILYGEDWDSIRIPAAIRSRCQNLGEDWGGNG